MKKLFLFIVILLLAILASCHSEKSAGQENGNSLVSSANSDAIVWNSEGGAYKQNFIVFPENSISLFAYGSDIYTIARNSLEHGATTYEIWKNNTEKLYTLIDGAINCAAASKDGIWVVETVQENSGLVERLCFLSFSGETIRMISANSIGDGLQDISAILCAPDTIYLRSDEYVTIISDLGAEIASYRLPVDSVGLVTDTNNNAYMVCYYEDRVEVQQIDETSLTPVFVIEDPDVKVFSGFYEHRFVMTNTEGLYGLTAYGNTTAIIIWQDCGLNFQKMFKVFSMPNGEVLCWSIEGLSILTPVDASELSHKIKLTVACLGNHSGIMSFVIGFNQYSDKYKVIIKDYSENGTYDTQTAAMRLNTELAGGYYPDLLLFNDLQPFAYISKGYLLDLNEYIDFDPEISRKDIVILDKLELEGGVYFLSRYFNIETLAGLYSEFGDRVGWTLDEYLEIEEELSPNAETLYNTTRSQFLYQLSARYLRSAVNWDTGKCDFNNDVFVSLLEAAARVNENPEDISNLDFTYGPVRVAKKTLVASASWVSTVWKLAFEEKMAGCKLSFIGWPTVDGSCGSDIYIYNPMGICSQTDYADGCWDFVKYMITADEHGGANMMPTYKPLLSALIDESTKKAPENGIQISAEDAKRFWGLLSEIENVALYDTIILEIIMDEASAFFAGARSANETAKMVQSRASIYLAELN